MRNYFPEYLGKEVYKRVISTARSYEEDKQALKEIKEEKIFASPAHRGSGGISKPVQSIVEQIEKCTKELRRRTTAVERSLAMFPKHEQIFIEKNIIKGVPMPQCGMRDCERTLKCIRHDFLIALAVELGEVIKDVPHGGNEK